MGDQRYGNRRVPKMYAEVNAHRQAVASGDIEKTQQTWDKIEEHIDYAYQRVAELDFRGSISMTNRIGELANDDNFVAEFITALAERIHASNVAAGWWSDVNTGESILHTRNVPEMLMLIVSEVAEAMEGHRKNLMDDKLPHRPMLQTELVDAVIRILDLAGSRMAIERENVARIEAANGCRSAHDLNPFGDILIEKMNYNRTRADHQIENRRKAGGKAF